MNKKVLRTMIFLCWGFLIAFAIMKILFADKLLVVINNERIIDIGNFIDARPWLQQIVYGLTTLLTYQFYLCACVKKWHLTVKQYVVLCIIIAATNTLKYYKQELSLIVNVLIMVILPFALKAEYKTFIIIFIAHYASQLIISYIRSEPLNLVAPNIVSQMTMMVDAYICLLLYYLYSNLYKENIMGNAMPPLWEKMSKEIEAEIKSIDEKIAKCEDENKKAKLIEKKEAYEKMLESDK